MTHYNRFRAGVVALIVLILLTTACAARKQAETSALTIGELALAIDQQERNAFEAGLYDAARHKQLGGLVLRVLYGARAYERAVVLSQDTALSKAELSKALNDLASAAKDVPIIVTAISTVRNALGGG